jgi:hypothetical protein
MPFHSNHEREQFIERKGPVAQRIGESNAADDGAGRASQAAAQRDDVQTPQPETGGRKSPLPARGFIAIKKQISFGASEIPAPLPDYFNLVASRREEFVDIEYVI